MEQSYNEPRHAFLENFIRCCELDYKESFGIDREKAAVIATRFIHMLNEEMLKSGIKGVEKILTYSLTELRGDWHPRVRVSGDVNDVDC